MPRGDRCELCRPFSHSTVFIFCTPPLFLSLDLRFVLPIRSTRQLRQDISTMSNLESKLRRLERFACKRLTSPCFVGADIVLPFHVQRVCSNSRYGNKQGCGWTWSILDLSLSPLSHTHTQFEHLAHSSLRQSSCNAKQRNAQRMKE